MLFDRWLWPTAGSAPLEPHRISIPCDPHGGLLQTRADDIGRHKSILKQAGPQARFH
jgi:hypothetical protein